MGQRRVTRRNGSAAVLLAFAVFAASVSPVSAQDETDISDAACDASPDSPQAECEACANNDLPIQYEICCCSPYSALVSTSPDADSCECKTQAGWALILLAILVPILIIGDIMLTVYCCYKGRCCWFKSSNADNKNMYNVHQGLPPGAEPNTPRYTASVPINNMGAAGPSTPPPRAPPAPTIQPPSTSRALADGPEGSTPRPQPSGRV
mmetsp:Transcript_16478/g.29388  ORF Transcript_16478/g.29388 Transcript_16478/m.29388 type:complete len:208 (-) Transcript_16478:18-641(-)